MSRMNQSCYIWVSNVSYEGVMSHIGEPFTCARVVSEIMCTSDSFIWDMTHSYGTWLIHTCLIYMGHDSFTWDTTHSYETWLYMYMSHVTYDSWEHDKFIWDMTHSYGTWLIYMTHDSCICDMTHAYMTRLHMHTSHVTYDWASCTCSKESTDSSRNLLLWSISGVFFASISGASPRSSRVHNLSARQRHVSLPGYAISPLTHRPNSIRGINSCVLIVLKPSAPRIYVSKQQEPKNMYIYVSAPRLIAGVCR